MKGVAPFLLALLAAGCGAEPDAGGAPPEAVDVPTPSGPPVVQQLNEQDDVQAVEEGRAR